MAVEFTEQWSTVAYDGQSASKGWVVVGTADPVVAANAVGVAKGDAYPNDDTLVATGTPSAEALGPQAFEVSADYAPREGEENNSNGAELLKQDPVWRWNVNLSREPVDMDINKNSITNSAKDHFEQPPQKDFADITLTVERYEKAYNFATALDYTNVVNSDDWKVVVGKKTREVVPKGCARCVGIIPMEDFTEKTEVVKVSYQFLIRKDGWKLRVEDRGFRRYVNGILGDHGKFVDIIDPKTLQRVAKPAQLNGKGGLYKGVDDMGSPKGAELEDTGTGMFLKYTLYDEKPFGAFGF